MNPIGQHVTGPMRRRPGLLRTPAQFTIIALTAILRPSLIWTAAGPPLAKPSQHHGHRIESLGRGRAGLITLALGDQCREAFSREAMAI